MWPSKTSFLTKDRNLVICTFILIWGALNITCICCSSNIIFGKYYKLLCAFQSIWCTYYHYDDDDRSNIMPCTSSVLFGSLCNPWWRTNNYMICSTFFFMVYVKYSKADPGPARRAPPSPRLKFIWGLFL